MRIIIIIIKNETLSLCACAEKIEICHALVPRDTTQTAAMVVTVTLGAAEAGEPAPADDVTLPLSDNLRHYNADDSEHDLQDLGGLDALQDPLPIGQPGLDDLQDPLAIGQPLPAAEAGEPAPADDVILLLLDPLRDYEVDRESGLDDCNADDLHHELGVDVEYETEASSGAAGASSTASASAARLSSARAASPVASASGTEMKSLVFRELLGWLKDREKSLADIGRHTYASFLAELELSVEGSEGTCKVTLNDTEYKASNKKGPRVAFTYLLSKAEFIHDLKAELGRRISTQSLPNLQHEVENHAMALVQSVALLVQTVLDGLPIQLDEAKADVEQRILALETKLSGFSDCYGSEESIRIANANSSNEGGD